MCPSASSHELTFQVNHLAPFLLTMLLHRPLSAGQALRRPFHAQLRCRPKRQPSDEPGPQREPGQVRAAATAGLVADPIQVGADGADADEQLRSDLSVGGALSD